jgi:DNA-binding PadR family transcriptional regulator
VRYLILDAIRAQPRHGYEIIQAIVEKSHGAYRPSPGVVYPTLQMLEEMQLARAVPQEDRKAYALTEQGEAELKQHDEEVSDFYEGHEGSAWETPAEDVARVMKRVGQLIKAFKRGAQRGYLGPGKMRKMLSILDEALDRLNELLDDDS